MDFLIVFIHTDLFICRNKCGQIFEQFRLSGVRLPANHNIAVCSHTIFKQINQRLRRITSLYNILMAESQPCRDFTDCHTLFGTAGFMPDGYAQIFRIGLQYRICPVKRHFHNVGKPDCKIIHIFLI